MCGFVGVFNFHSAESVSCGEAQLREAMEVIRHRGPDDSSVTATNHYAIGFNRLSINDLSTNAMQPFAKDGVRIFVNGEIYNHKELEAEEAITPESGSDCEIVLHLYLKYGLAFLPRLNGMFAMVIVDDRSNELHLVQDRFSVKPLYYLIDGEEVLFASEIKALKALRPSCRIDGTAIDLSLSTTDVVAPYSPFKEVRKPFPGRRMHFADGKMSTETWYRFNGLRDAKPVEFNRARFFELFEAAIERRLEADVEMGAFLSGGLDSSLITTKMRGMVDDDIHVFNAVIEDKIHHEPDHDNINARRLAEDIGLVYHPVEINKDVYMKNIVRYAAAHDELLMDSGDFIFYAMSETATQYVTVILDGVGADEMFGGYPWQNRVKKLSNTLPDGSFYSRGLYDLLNRINPRPAALYRYLSALSLSHASSLGMLAHADIDNYANAESYVRESYAEFDAELPGLVTGDHPNHVDALNYLSIIPFQNVKCDRGAMFSSLENRSPFLDYHLVEYMMSLPSAKKGEPGRKEIERSLLKGVVPDYVLQSPKSGPTFPLDFWLKSDQDLYNRIVAYLKRNAEQFDQVGSGIGAALHTLLDKGECDGLKLHAFTSALIWIKARTDAKSFDPSISLDDFIAAG